MLLNKNTKEKISDLAIFGGTPAFSKPLYVGRPNIGDRKKLLTRIEDALDRRWLTNDGPYVQQFERSIAETIGVKHCIAVCNGTVALELVIRAAGLSGEVLIPSFTFIATAHALQWQQITPVFCDIDPQTYNMDPKAVEKMITPRTTGIIGVHLWGRPCAIEDLAKIAHRKNLKLLFDASHAFGCSYKKEMIGNFGLAEVFSFHATKVLNTFEGGAVVTNNDALAQQIRLMRNFGFVDYDKVIYIGTNGKMNEISAAMGITGLEALDEFIAANRRNYQAYREALQSIKGIKLLTYNEKEKCNFHYVVLEIEEKKIGLSRNELAEILHAENVIARRYFFPGCHKMEPYASYFPNAGVLLPETEHCAKRIICLPTGITAGLEEIKTIVQIIRLVIQGAAEIKARLGG